jgi:hypothetical protein
MPKTTEYDGNINEYKSRHPFKMTAVSLNYISNNNWIGEG